jgi:phage tail-like protein
MGNYPLTTNHFSVEWGGSNISFTEVSGLAIGVEPIDFKEGSSPVNSSKKLPGRLKYSNVILTRGMSRGDNELYNWLKTIQHNAVERRDLVISLLNESHERIIAWKLKNAFPVQVSWSDLNANANEPAIESIELTHEGMFVEHF